MESNEDTFKPEVIFKSFHHQARISISDRALLVGFLMLWLKTCVVPTLPHGVIVADVVYSVVLLTHDRSLALVLATVGCIQSGLWVLTRSFCQVEPLVDEEGNPLIDRNSKPH